jgi:predicted nucleic acid-binding protein
VTPPVRFADSFYFIALLNSRDRCHEAAKAATRGGSGRLVTTSLVLVEVADALSAPPTRALVHESLGRIHDDPNADVVLIGQDWLDRGMVLYGSRPDKAWSLTDCVSFVVMIERGLTEALTGDHHFEQTGFRALLKSP